MHTIAEINLLLDDLDELPADDLEDQELDCRATVREACINAV